MGLSVISLSGFLLAAAGGLPPGVSIEGEALLDCPPASAVRHLLAATDGLEVAAANATVDIWALTLRRSGDNLQIALRDPGGVSRLFRELPVGSGECDAAARAAAIVVERYFRDLAWVPDASVAGLPTAPGEPATVAVGSTDVRPPAAAPRFVVGAGPAYWTRPGGLSVLIDGRMRVAGPIWAGAGTLLLPFRSDETLGAGDVAARASGVPVLGRLGVSDVRGRFGFRLGVEALLTFERAKKEHRNARRRHPHRPRNRVGGRRKHRSRGSLEDRGRSCWLPRCAGAVVQDSGNRGAGAGTAAVAGDSRHPSGMDRLALNIFTKVSTKGRRT